MSSRFVVSFMIGHRHFSFCEALWHDGDSTYSQTTGLDQRSMEGRCAAPGKAQLEERCKSEEVFFGFTWYRSFGSVSGSSLFQTLRNSDLIVVAPISGSPFKQKLS
jgi:hypothetical protein